MLRGQISKFLTVKKFSSISNNHRLKIGSVKIPRRHAKNPALVPAYYGLSSQPSDLILHHLKWLIQKDLMRQDVFLLGVPGKLRTEVVLRYLEATNREFEYLSITRDTTEADIKQRREIKNGTAYYTDLCAVRAALTGRVLVIDGVERAERNVLPILNNLLENREMQLEDGRFLMKHDKYDELKEKYDDDSLKKMGLERVSEDFHVVALGLPVPRFPGSTLDPPFRSRFQCRNVDESSFQEILSQARQLAPNVDEFHLNNLLSLVYAYNSEATSSRPRIAISVIENSLKIWNSNPNYNGSDIIDMCYPAKEFLSDNEKDVIGNFKKKFEIEEQTKNARRLVDKREPGIVHISDGGKNIELEVPIFEKGEKYPTNWVPTHSQEQLLADLSIAFSNGDLTLLGTKGSGKSTIVKELANRLGFNFVSMVLHQDMNTREFVQRRRMNENGDTIWEDSPLVEAARKGNVCVLDGVEMIHPSVLLSLSQLVYHRRFDLPNGHRLIGEKEFKKLSERNNLNEEQLAEQGIYKIPNSFRILFVGESHSKDHKWINENILAMVPFFRVPILNNEEQLTIISNFTGSTNKSSMRRLVNFVQKLGESHDNGLKNVANSLSLRRLIHIAKRDNLQPGHLRELVEKATLFKFLPTLTKETLQKELDNSDITNDEMVQSRETQSFIEMIKRKERKVEDEALIPDVLFHDNKQHVETIEDMARDVRIGGHLLLIGNQGVGKNKLTDRFLHLINRPRQYIQLHRDTTVQTLTLQTVVKNGILSHEDSALVKAAKNGQILVIDEADKAPVHVIAILKGLLDTGYLVLGDGRTMKLLENMTDEEKKNTEKFVGIHPDFKIIMLANRPGFPFLGNNLFAVLGDLFAIHMIDYPSKTSELGMIKKYGPNVDNEILNKLLSIFSDLRDKTDQGLLQYPYSTRELVNIVKHCNEFPEDSLNEVARNVFDFDLYNDETISTIESVFQKHGIPLGVEKKKQNITLAQRKSIGKLIDIGKWKMIKIDENMARFSNIEQIELTKIANLSKKSLKMDKNSMRNEMFSEQHTYWKLPIGDDNIISDAVRITSGLVVSMVNPPQIHWIKNLRDDEKVTQLDIKSIIPTKRFQTYKPRIRLAQLGDNLILLHEEVDNGLFVINLADKTASSVGRKETLSDQIGAIFSKPTSLWRMTPSNKNSAILYERDGNEMFIYSASSWDVNGRHGTMSFKIQKVLPIGENEWLVISMNNDIYHLKTGSDEIKMLKLEHTSKEMIELIMAKRLNSENKKDEMMLVTDSHYYLELKKNSMKAIKREDENLEQMVDSRRPYYLADEVTEKNIDTAREIAFLDDNIVRSMPKWKVPKNMLAADIPPSYVAGFLEVVDTSNNEICHVPVPASQTTVYQGEWMGSITRTGFLLIPWTNEKILAIGSGGEIRAFELKMSSLLKSFNDWRRMISGNDNEKLRMEFEREKDQIDMSKLDEPKLGKIDPNNAPHHGGNQWMGGTGGYNTAGLGGVGGPFRLDAGHDVHQMPDFAKQQVPDHILKKAREIAKEEYAKKLREINMSEYEGEAYEKVWKNVKTNVKKLSSVIEQLEAKKTERVWEKHQTSGDLDDGKLIEGITGEQNIYRRRIDKKPEIGAPQIKPKRLKLCFDVSGSMYRFNGYDKRLQKSLETALMMMVAMEGKTDRVEYDIIGHSGESPRINFVNKDNYPKNNKDRLVILKQMLAHTQFCMSGDNTVECLYHAVDELAKKQDYDETVVVLISDANLERYGIHPKQLHKEMIKHPNVKSFVIFIGSLGEQADILLKNLPVGKSFVLKEANELPKIMETIFASTMSQ